MNIQQVQTIIADAMEKHNGIVKKEELTRLGIDYRRIDTLVREGKLVRITYCHNTSLYDNFFSSLICLKSTLTTTILL